MSYSNDEVTGLQDLQQKYGQGEEGTYYKNDAFSWGPELSSGTPVYDHAGELYQTGNRLDQNLTWSGGSDRTTYYLSLGRMSQEGIIKGNSAFDRTNLRLRGGHAFRDDLRVSASVSYSNSHADLIQPGSNVSGIQLGALRTPPDFNNTHI